MDLARVKSLEVAAAAADLREASECRWLVSYSISFLAFIITGEAVIINFKLIRWDYY
jgi:hypothetical protein